MQVTSTLIPDLVTIEPDVFFDERGHFFESFSTRRYAAAAGIDSTFVQDNHTQSSRGVLRGLHYQLRQPQGKLLRVVMGEIFDVGVDLRRSSSTFGQWQGVVLSAQNRRQFWLPPGFAHGFLVLSEQAVVLYKATAYYDPGDEYCLHWNDSSIGIEWPMPASELVLSERDQAGRSLAQTPLFP